MEDPTQDPTQLPGYGETDPSDPYSSDRAVSLLVLNIVFLLLATLALIARFWSRHIKGTRHGLDDWLLLVGLFFYYLNCADRIWLSASGFGHHVYNGVTKEQFTLISKLNITSQYLYVTTMAAIRWSICHTLYRIFVTRWFRRCILSLLILNIVWWIYAVLFASFRCIPFSGNWNMGGPATCISQYATVVSVAAWGLLIEVFIWSLPLPAVWQLKLPRSAKIGLTLIFGLGLFDVGVGIARVVTIFQIDPKDYPWTGVPAIQWLIVEPSIAMVVVCLCVCRPLLEKLLPRVSMPQFLSTGRFRRSSDSLPSGYSRSTHGTPRMNKERNGSGHNSDEAQDKTNLTHKDSNTSTHNMTNEKHQNHITSSAVPSSPASSAHYHQQR